MSFEVIWDNVEKFRSSTHLLVAVVIKTYSRADGVCYAYRRTLAKRAKLHEKTIQKCILELAEDGILHVSGSVRADGSQGANRITFSMGGVLDSATSAEELMPHVDPDAEPGRRRGRPPLPPSPSESSGVGASDSSKKESGSSENLESDSNSGGAKAPDPIVQAFNAYNSFANSHSWTVATKLTSGRKKSLGARIEQVGGIEGWKKALKIIPQSKFLMGLTKPADGRKRFRMSLDFLLQESSLQKLVEGSYHEGKGLSIMSRGDEDEPMDALRKDRALQERVVLAYQSDPASWLEFMGPKPKEPGCVIDKDILEKHFPRERAKPLQEDRTTSHPQGPHLVVETSASSPTPALAGAVDDDPDVF